MVYTFSITGSQSAAVPVRRKNPFNGQFVDIYPPALTDAEMAEAKRVLARYGARAEEDGRLVLQLSDGTAVEVVAGLDAGRESGRWTVSFSAYLQRLNREAMQFLFEICSAGNFILDGGDVGVVTDAAVMDRHRDDGFALAHSPEEMEILVKEGMNAYKEYIAGKSAFFDAKDPAKNKFE